MKVTVIYPPDLIGDSAQEFEYKPKNIDASEVLKEARQAFQDPSKGGQPARLNIRLMLVGDMIKIDDRHYIVTAQSFRQVPQESAENWLKRTLIERSVGSGHHARISGEYQNIKEKA